MPNTLYSIIILSFFTSKEGLFLLQVFTKPLLIIIGLGFITALGIASDIAQLTDFNIVDVIKSHSPYSYFFLFGGIIVIYLILVIVEFIRSKNKHSRSETRMIQSIRARDVNNSALIQINNSKED